MSLSKKIKVLQVIPDIGAGGAERLVVDICNNLSQQKNIELVLLTFSTNNAYKDITSRINMISCIVKYSPKILRKDIINVEELDAVIDNFKPDIIHTHLLEADQIVHQHIHHGIIYITSPHSNKNFYKKTTLSKLFSKDEIIRIILRKRLIKKYNKCSHFFITNSQNAYDFYKTNLNVGVSFIKNLGGATDLSRFKPTDILQQPKPIKLLTVGSLNKNKNQIFILRAVKKLLNAGYKAHLNIIGTGEEQEALEKYIKENDLNDYVSLLGHVTTPEKYYWTSSLYIHSSKQEGFGLVLSEAMACGLPCIALDNIGDREIIQNGINGYIIRPDDMEGFCNKIIETSNNESLYKTLQKGAIETSKKFDISHYVNELISIYIELLGRHAAK